MDAKQAEISFLKFLMRLFLGRVLLPEGTLQDQENDYSPVNHHYRNIDYTYGWDSISVSNAYLKKKDIVVYYFRSLFPFSKRRIVWARFNIYQVYRRSFPRVRFVLAFLLSLAIPYYLIQSPSHNVLGDYLLAVASYTFLVYYMLVCLIVNKMRAIKDLEIELYRSELWGERSRPKKVKNTRKRSR